MRENVNGVGCWLGNELQEAKPTTVTIHEDWSEDELCLCINGEGIDDFTAPFDVNDDKEAFQASAWMTRDQALALAEQLVQAANRLPAKKD